MLMKNCALVALACVCATPAAAAVNVIATNVDFSAAPYTFGVTPTDTFTLTYDARGQFDPDPVLVRTAGTAQVTAIFGQPSVNFTDPPSTFGPNSFPGFASIPTDTRAPFTLTASDLGLRYTVGADTFYGYARFAGSNLIKVAFEDQAGVPILAGSGAVAAVPEPAAWALMLIGFGAIGTSMRRRPAMRPAAVTA